MADDQLQQLIQQITRLGDKFDGLEDRLEKRLDERFAEQDKRLDERFSQVDERFAQIDDRFAKQDKRLDSIESRLTKQGEHFDEQILKLYQHTEERFDQLQSDISDVRQDVRHVYDTIDGLAKRIETDEQERTAITHQLDRHEDWIARAAPSLNIEYLDS